MDTVKIGDLNVSRFIIGGNPFSGFSHQGIDMDNRMQNYYTTDKIKETLRSAEALGINTVLSRCDAHICRLMLEYKAEGGKLHWFAQTAPELGPPENSVTQAAAYGASACYIHGGVVDFLLAQGRMNEIPPVIDLIRNQGLAAGIAGHNPSVFRYAEEHKLDVDFYMCSYYNPTPRDENPEHIHGAKEWFYESDRKAMTQLIQTLSKLVIHYKVLAAGRNCPAEAFRYAAQNLRSTDMVCIGIFNENVPNMIEEDIALFEEALAGRDL